MKEYSFKINGKQYDVTVESVEGKNAQVTVNGAAYSVEIEKGAAEAPAAAPVAAPAPQAAPAQTAPVAAPAPAAKPAGPGTKVESPLPGVIIEVSVKEGQAVKMGQKVAVLEAMKMENEIAATADGTVTAIHVAKGDSVLEGAPIVTIA
ncbi:MAG: biotin/lipoyl-binding protein [Bacteroidales bacterium]|nr:biotin/lipoyl-binding protein [Bacteroidales bacterium]